MKLTWLTFYYWFFLSLIWLAKINVHNCSDEKRNDEYFIPIFYNLTIVPNLINNSFEGNIVAMVYVDQKTLNVLMEEKKLEIWEMLQEHFVVEKFLRRIIDNSHLKQQEVNLSKANKAFDGFDNPIKIHFVYQFNGNLRQLRDCAKSCNDKEQKPVSPLHNFKGISRQLGSLKSNNIESNKLKKNFTMSFKSEISPRIPEYVKPIYYNLMLNPNLESGKFYGSVNITVEITDKATYIPINLKNLKITHTELHRENGTIIELTTAHDVKNEFWIIKALEKQYFQPGRYIISLNFNGGLLGKNVGFYRSTYLSKNKKERYIATTKFEPVDARQAFPCFDEPSLKAKFKVCITRPKEYSALSNTYVEKEENGPEANQITVHFEETVPISTYLVCFIVSDFVNSGTEIIDNKGVDLPIKIYSTPQQIENTLFAKKVAADVVKFYIEYFDIPYALPKLDLIAIPDFVSGAMENWGLITFREAALLFNETHNSVANKERVAVTVAHEISHQWFGNLVTMKWWNDLWLNEGFASFMQYKGVDEGIPSCRDWQMLDKAIHTQIHEVLRRDSISSSHPIIANVTSPNEINEIFDKISYNKGHALLKMVEGFMGKKRFQKGLQNYLKKYEFSNAATVDLWSMLTEQMVETGINVQDVMDTWTKQMGYPVINVLQKERDWFLTQERFLSYPNATFNISESPYGYKWDIPIYYSTVSNPEIDLTWFNRTQDVIKIPLEREGQLIKINSQQLGYYRVNYDTKTWKQFEILLKSNHETLHRVDRANIIDDVFSLANANKVSYEVALNMIGYLKKEKDYLPWATASNVLCELIEFLSSGRHYASMRKYVRSLVAPLYGKNPSQFSWNVRISDSHIDRQLRVTILSLACTSGLPSCLEDVGKLFLNWIKDPNTVIHPDVRSLVFSFGMSTVGNEREWDVVWERYLQEEDVQLKLNLLQSLANVREPWILSRFIELSKNETYIRSQDYFLVLGYISKNPVGNPIVWKFYRQEWSYLDCRFSLYHRNFGSFIETLTNRFSTQVELKELLDFYQEHFDAGAGKNARKIALENVKQNINWRAINEEAVGDWLKNYSAIKLN